MIILKNLFTLNLFSNVANEKCKKVYLVVERRYRKRRKGFTILERYNERTLGVFGGAQIFIHRKMAALTKLKKKRQKLSRRKNTASHL